jgi:adenylylsulfate kinase
MAVVVWFTGLSGAGKSTIARGLKERLEQINKKVLIVDGDAVRETAHRHLGFSPEDIHENNRLIAELAQEKAPEYDYILVPIISPYRADRAHARQVIGNNFVELFLNCSVEQCAERDTKGLYAKAERGEIANLIGVSPSNPYEAPTQPEIQIETSTQTPEESIADVFHFLVAKE